MLVHEEHQYDFLAQRCPYHLLTFYGQLLHCKLYSVTACSIQRNGWYEDSAYERNENFIAKQSHTSINDNWKNYIIYYKFKCCC